MDYMSPFHGVPRKTMKTKKTDEELYKLMRESQLWRGWVDFTAELIQSVRNEVDAFIAKAEQAGKPFEHWQDAWLAFIADAKIPELQKRLMAALPELTMEDFDYHETDLYVLAKPGVYEWLKANYEHMRNVRGFKSNPECSWKGAFAYDIPFAGRWQRT